MAINFNELPTNKPGNNGSLIAAGNYIAEIKKAEMKQGKDETKPPYLNMMMEITDPASQAKVGNIFCILTESDRDFPRYMLMRFITALKLPITGAFELKDLTKMIVNKKLRVDICPEETDNGESPQRSIVDIKSGELFYPLEYGTEEHTQANNDAIREAAGQVFAGDSDGFVQEISHEDAGDRVQY